MKPESRSLLLLSRYPLFCFHFFALVMRWNDKTASDRVIVVYHSDDAAKHLSR